MVSAATLNIKVSPRRMLSEREAAEYIGLTLKRFQGARPVAPIEMPGKVLVYDMRDLDAFIDQRKVGASDNDDDILAALG
ncbi:MAG: hypothetical protein DI589_13730 [Shinella sp.]|jgi:hypothetical protein|nr:MAG: hypothetical protein DI589_13730 [Shinella sp.]